jgi:hypothetical protein
MPFKDPTKKAEYQREYMRKWYDAHPGYNRNYLREWNKRNPGRMTSYLATKDPLRIKARKAVSRAVETGKLLRPAYCEACGLPTNVQGHHDDYTKPLDVRWVCDDCHQLIHHPISK